MYLNVGYQIFDSKKLLGTEKYEKLVAIVNEFQETGMNIQDIKTPLYFLRWSSRIQNIFQTEHPEDYVRIITDEEFSYADYLKMCEINQTHGVHHGKGDANDKNNNSEDWDYMNFYLISRDFGTYSHMLGFVHDIGREIVKLLYNKKSESATAIVPADHFNVYPKGSFISRHTDGQALPPNPRRLFTLLYFLNTGRTKQDGSILKVFTENDVVEIVPDISRVVLLDHANFNYHHEVTENLIENVRYTVYAPFYENNYQKLVDL